MPATEIYADMAIVRSLCGQCGMGCGVRAMTGMQRNVRIEGDKAHPANAGRLCERAGALTVMTDLDGRMLHPLVDGKPQSWDRSIAHIAKRLAAVQARHGPGSVALHVGGGLLTEDYYVANKLMKGFLGSAHIHAPWRGAIGQVQRAAYGEDVMPAALEDIDRAELILIADPAALLAHPLLLERVQHARATRGTSLVVLGDGDGLETDMRVPVRAGSVGRLLAGWLLHSIDGGLIDADFVARHVTIPDGFRDRLAPGHDLWSVARACGIEPGQVRDFYDAMGAADHCVTLFGETAGADVAAAAINLHLLTGRIGRPGAAPFALPSGANSMGAREVGCHADELAAHGDFSEPVRANIARFWGARQLVEQPGLEGDALLDAMRDGKVRALWSIGTDDGAAEWLRAARSAVPLSIRSTDRAEEAADGWTLCLSSANWIEKDGTVTGLDRLVSRQRRLFDLPGAARPDWWMLTRVAQAMGWGDAFHYEQPADIYREYGRLTAYRNDGTRLLNLRRHAPISNPAYAELTPWRWGEVPFDGGHFPTPDGRARLLPIAGQAEAAIP